MPCISHLSSALPASQYGHRSQVTGRRAIGLSRHGSHGYSGGRLIEDTLVTVRANSRRSVRLVETAPGWLRWSRTRLICAATHMADTAGRRPNLPSWPSCGRWYQAGRGWSRSRGRAGSASPGWRCRWRLRCWMAPAGGAGRAGAGGRTRAGSPHRGRRAPGPRGAGTPHARHPSRGGRRPLPAGGPGQRRACARRGRQAVFAGGWTLEAAGLHLRGPDEAVWLDRLEVEFDNIRAALAFSLADPDSAEPGLRLAAGLRWSCTMRGHGGEVLEALNVLLVATRFSPSACG